MCRIILSCENSHFNGVGNVVTSSGGNPQQFVCNRRYSGEKPGPKRPARQLPADGAGATAACLSSRKGTTAPHSLPSPSALGAVPLQLGRWGRREERVSQAPRGEAGQGKVRKVTAQRWTWYHPSGSSLLLGYLLWSRFRCPVCQAAENVTLGHL